MALNMFCCFKAKNVFLRVKWTTCTNFKVGHFYLTNIKSNHIVMPKSIIELPCMIHGPLYPIMWGEEDHVGGLVLVGTGTSCFINFLVSLRYAADVWRIYGRWSADTGEHTADMRRICGGHVPVRLAIIRHFDVSLSWQIYGGYMTDIRRTCAF